MPSWVPPFPYFYSVWDPSPWEAARRHLGWVFPTSLKLSGYTITRPTQGVSLNPVNWTMKIDYLRSRLKLDLGVLQDSETKITDAPEVTEMKVKVKHWNRSLSNSAIFGEPSSLDWNRGISQVRGLSWVQPSLYFLSQTWVTAMLSVQRQAHRIHFAKRKPTSWSHATDLTGGALNISCPHGSSYVPSEISRSHSTTASPLALLGKWPVPRS